MAFPVVNIAQPTVSDGVTVTAAWTVMGGH